MKILIFANKYNPQTHLYISHLKRYISNKKIFFVFDNKKMKIKDVNIWKFRTKNKFRLDKSYLKKISHKIVKIRHNTKKFERYLKDHNFSLGLNCGTPRILNSNVINSFKIGVVNIHPGKLPDLRGCTCVEWALYLKRRVYNTAHLMNEQIDHGRIIKFQRCEMKKNYQYHDIRNKVYESGYILMRNILGEYLRNKKLKSKNLKKGGKYFKPIDNKVLVKLIETIKRGNYL